MEFFSLVFEFRIVINFEGENSEKAKAEPLIRVNNKLETFSKD